MKKSDTIFSLESTMEIKELLKKIDERIIDIHFVDTAEDYKFDLQTKKGTKIIAEFNEFSYYNGRLDFFHTQQHLQLEVDVEYGGGKYYNKFALDHNVAPKDVTFTNIEDLKILLSVLDDEIDISLKK